MWRLGVAVVPVILAAAVLWSPIFEASIPMDVTGVLVYPPWEEARPDGFVPLNDHNALMESSVYYPDYAFLSRCAHTGQAPWWNPLEGGGMPFMARWQTRCFSPFSLPFYVLPLHMALMVSALLKLIVAAWMAYYAARKFGLMPPLALAAALSFELSAPLILWISAPMADVLPWMPLFLVAAEKFGAGYTRGWPQAALVIALMALGGGPRTLAAAILFVAVYIVSRFLHARTPLRALTSVLALCMSVAAGLALAGIQLIPYFEYLRNATASTDGTATHLLFSDIVSLFFVSLWDFSAIWDNARDPNVLRMLQVGVIQVWLAALWIAVRSYAKPAQRARMDAMLTGAGVLTAFAFFRPYLPLISRLQPEHLLAFNALATGLAASATAEVWLALNAEECGKVVRRIIIGIPVLLIIALVSILSNYHILTKIPWRFVLQSIATVGLFACLGGLLTITLLRPSMRLMGVGLCVLTVSAFFGARLEVRTTPKELAFPKTSLIAALQSTGQRIGGSSFLPMWPLGGNLVPQTFPSNGAGLVRQMEFVKKSLEKPELAARAGTRYMLLTGADIRGAWASIRPMLSIRNVFSSGAILFEHLKAKPRAWLAYETRNADEFKPELIKADLPPVVEHTAEIPSGEGPQGKANVNEDFNSWTSIDVDTSRPGVLILADSWYPGWYVFIDGQSSSAFAVDGAFRGVEVPEGKHTVVFEYAPVSLRAGLYTTLAAALIILMGFYKITVEHFQSRHAHMKSSDQ
jgi:hypothetical protein